MVKKKSQGALENLGWGMRDTPRSQTPYPFKPSTLSRSRFNSLDWGMQLESSSQPAMPASASASTSAFAMPGPTLTFSGQSAMPASNTGLIAPPIQSRISRSIPSLPLPLRRRNLSIPRRRRILLHPETSSLLHLTSVLQPMSSQLRAKARLRCARYGLCARKAPNRSCSSTCTSSSSGGDTPPLSASNGSSMSDIDLEVIDMVLANLTHPMANGSTYSIANDSYSIANFTHPIANPAIANRIRMRRGAMGTGDVSRKLSSRGVRFMRLLRRRCRVLGRSWFSKVRCLCSSLQIKE
ncbi:hypothetical protein C8J56DRAFT_122859 [Mycena floridula]|nr:hypothetical protein C8J56DRAFT_122859 [Mycena floridula]